MKVCRKCEVELPDTSFHSARANSDGLQSYCMTCMVEYRRKYYRQNRVKEIARTQAYIASSPECVESRRKSRQKNSDRNRARSCVSYAVKTGKLVRPDVCGGCGGSDLDIHAHHEDYSKKLDVEWLCSMCHGGRHRA